MNLKGKSAAVLFLAAMGLSTAARAMTIHDFGRMNNDDEATYVALLIEGSAKKLKAEGKTDQATELIAYFKVPGKFGGVQQFAAQVEAVDALNKRNAINPNNRVPEYQIEDAMELTLKDKGFIVPAKYLLALNRGFVPEGPPRSRIGP